MVGEPPVHVDRAADALKLVLHAGRKSDVAVPDRFGFSGARFADNDVPGEFVEIFAARFISLDAGLKFLAHVVQTSAWPGSLSLRGVAELCCEISPPNCWFCCF